MALRMVIFFYLFKALSFCSDLFQFIFSGDGDQQMCSVAGRPVRLHSAAHVLSSKNEPAGGWSKFDWITFSYLQLIDRFLGVWKPMRVKNDLQVAFWNSYWKVGHAKLLFEGCLGQGANLESFGFCSAEPLTDHSLDHAMFRHGSRTAMALLFEVK